MAAIDDARPTLCRTPRPARLAAVALALAVVVALPACSGDPGDPGDGGAADPLTPRPTVRPPTATFALPEQLGVVDHPALTDASGMVASRATPGNFWFHNDADAAGAPGGGALLFCTGFQGASCGVALVAGVEAVDWEDIAAGPGPEPGVPYLYVGDIGDRGGDRDTVVVYRVREPTLPTDPLPTTEAPFVLEGAEALHLRYPDGARDAEALMVHPTSGDLYVMSRETAMTRVYVARAPLDAGTETALTEVAALDVGFANARSRQVVAGDIAPDGRHVSFMTYAEGYELALPPGAAFDEIWTQLPVPIHLPDRLTGEALTYRSDSGALVTTNEGIPANLHQMERREPPTS